MIFPSFASLVLPEMLIEPVSNIRGHLSTLLGDCRRPRFRTRYFRCIWRRARNFSIRIWTGGLGLRIEVFQWNIGALSFRFADSRFHLLETALDLTPNLVGQLLEILLQLQLVLQTSSLCQSRRWLSMLLLFNAVFQLLAFFQCTASGMQGDVGGVLGGVASFVETL